MFSPPTAMDQKINMSKSSIFFERHYNAQIRDDVKVRLQVDDESLESTYLGMPT
jgi:hypothetical protein